MTIAKQPLRLMFAACGLLAVVACGDDTDGDEPVADSGTPVADSGTPVADSGPAVQVDSGSGHQHDLDAAVADAQVVVDAAPDPTCTATISLQDFKLVPADSVVTAGAITLCARNDGRAQHDLALRGSDNQTVAKTVTLNPGESGRFNVTVSAGSSVLFCSLPGHESLGMVGTLTAR